MTMVDWGRIGTAIGTMGLSEAGGLRPIADQLNGGDIFGDPAADAERRRKELLYQQAEAAGRFATQGQNNYEWATDQGREALGGLRALTRGENSVSAEQLRQALQQNQAAQMSMAASASPQNAAMAARTAAIQSARLGAGLAGQQALAGLQERQQAWNQYGGLLQGLRGQDLQAAIGSRQNALAGYGAANAGMPEKSWLEKYGPAIQSGLSVAAMASDRRLKTEVRDGSKLAGRALDTLSKNGGFTYQYKDQRNGKGEQLGLMAQDLERTPGLKHTVIDTPAGKVVHGGKLAAAIATMLPEINKRVSKLEGRAR